MGLSFKRISISSSISVPNYLLLPQNPQLFHHSAGLWEKFLRKIDVVMEFKRLVTALRTDVLSLAPLPYSMLGNFWSTAANVSSSQPTLHGGKGKQIFSTYYVQDCRPRVVARWDM